MADALKASLQHESLKKVVRELRASIEGKFGLVTVQVCQHRPPNVLLCFAMRQLSWCGGALHLQLSSECATQVGSEFAVSTVEQQLQIKALRTLNACLTASTVDAREKFAGAPIT